MKDLNLTPDDPLLTAYALGELEGEDLAAVETAVRRDPKLLAVVNEIRLTTAQLEAALAAEPNADSVAAAAANSTMRHPEFDEYRRVKRGPIAQMFQFPQVYFVVGGAAAACFAIMAVLHTPPPAPIAKAKPVKYIQVPIAFEPVEKATTSDQAMTVSVGHIPSAPVSGPAAPVEPAGPAPSPSGLAKAPEMTPSATVTPAVVATSEPTSTPAPSAPAPETLRGASDEKPAKEFGQDAATAVVAVTPVPSPVAPPESATRSSDALGRVPAPEIRPPASRSGVTITFAPEVTFGLPQPANRSGAASTPPEGIRPLNSRPIASAVPVITPTLRIGTAEPRVAMPTPAAPAPGDDTLVDFDAAAKGKDSRAAAAALTFNGGAKRTASAGKKPPAPRGALFARNVSRRATTPDNDFLGVVDNPHSTFPIEVGTESYDEIRGTLAVGVLPARDAVRIEELVNFFPYRYAAPGPRDDAPVAQALEVAAAPWAPSHRLVRVAFKTRESSSADRLGAIAQDVKVEVTFNSAKVSSYRLIGFENPRLNPDDYERQDGVDIFGGQTITALYEVIPIGLEAARVADKPSTSSQLYQSGVVVTSRLEMPDQEQKLTDELFLVSVAYRKPDSFFKTIKHAIFRGYDAEKRFDEASTDFKFAAAVAEYGMILRGSPHRGNGTLGDVLAWAAAGTGSNADDPRGYRSEFLNVVRRTQALMR